MAEEFNVKQIRISIFIAIAAIIAVSGAVVKYTEKLEQLASKSQTCLAASEQNKQSIKSLEKKTQERELQYMEIKTKLDGIEASLLDIKKSLN